MGSFVTIWQGLSMDHYHAFILKRIRMFFVSLPHSTLSINDAVISEFKAAVDHYRSPLCDHRPLLIQSQTAMCLCL